MPRANVFIPLAHGLDTKLDERLRAPEQLATLTNGYQRKNGAAFKRHGFTKLATTILDETGRLDNQGLPRGLFSTGNALCARGYRSLYEYVPAKSEWVNRGSVSPCAVGQTTVFDDQRSFFSSDLAINNGLCLYKGASVRSDNVGIASWQYAVNYAVTDATTRQVLFTRSTPELAGSIADAKFSGVLCVPNGATKIIAGHQSTQGGATNLVFDSFDTATLLLTQSAIQKNDLYFGGASYVATRAYDVCKAFNYWAYAYVEKVNQAIKVFLMNDTAVVATVTLGGRPGPIYECVAIANGPLGGKIYVFGYDNNHKKGTVYALNNPAFTTAWATDVVLPSAQQEVRGLGIVEGTATDSYLATSADYVVCAWSMIDTVPTPAIVSAENWTLTWAPMTLSGTDPGGGGGPIHAATPVYNAYASTKPWFENGRCYIGCHPWIDADGYGSAAVLDMRLLDASGAGGAVHRIVAAYNSGTAPTGYGVAGGANMPSSVLSFGFLPPGVGSLPGVWQSPSGPYRFMDNAIGVLLDKQFTKLRADELELDFAATLGTGVTTRGAALLAGGVNCWFSGFTVTELGFVHGPTIVPVPGSVGSNVAGGMLVPGDISYQVVYETYDDDGAWVRSVPSDVRVFTLGANKNTLSIFVRMPGVTSRYNVKRFGIGLYRADAAGQFVRINEPIRAMLDAANFTFPVFVDEGTIAPGPTIYTQGGAELEASGCDGAALVACTASRAWLGRFARRERVQYTKPLVAASANDAQKIPEFHGSFAFPLPRGKECTALAELDDKLIVFTASEVLAIAGAGPDAAGRGGDFSGLTTINTDTGCIESRSVVSFAGGLMFQAKAGFYILDRGLQVSFFGQAVQADLSAYGTVTSAVLVPAASHVRFTCRDVANTRSIILVFDYNNQAWSRWEPKRASGAALDIVGACMHQDIYYVLEADGTVWLEDAAAFKDDVTGYIPMTIGTSWLQATQGGIQRIRQVLAMAQKADNHALTVSLYQDFAATPSQTFTWTEALVNQFAAANVREWPMPRARVQKCSAFRVEIVDQASAGTTTGEGYNCGGFMVELGPKRGAAKQGQATRS